MGEFLLYIDFRGDELRPFYTFLGGVIANSFTSTKNPVETADFTKDVRMLISGSGVKEFTLNISGVLEDYQTQFDLLFKAHNEGKELPVMLSSGDNGFTIKGNFIISALSGDSPANVQNSFTMNLLSSGEVTTTKND